MGDKSQAVVAKTGNYTVSVGDSGTLFTNRGAAGSVTFTLPDTSTIFGLTGFQVEFFTCAAQTIVVASAPTDTLTVDSDLTADTITTAALVGQHLRVIYDGTSWLVIVDPSAATAATAVRAMTIVS